MPSPSIQQPNFSLCQRSRCRDDVDAINGKPAHQPSPAGHENRWCIIAQALAEPMRLLMTTQCNKLAGQPLRRRYTIGHVKIHSWCQIRAQASAEVDVHSDTRQIGQRLQTGPSHMSA